MDIDRTKIKECIYYFIRQNYDLKFGNCKKVKLFLFIPLNYFSVYSLIPNKDAIAREEYSRPLKTKYIPNLKRDLKPGWLFPHLYNHDALLHGRWEYWHRLQLVPAEKFHLLQEPDPNAPKSIHQKYWREKYQDIYPVNLLERDWSNEVQKIIDLQSARVKAPEIANQESNFEFTEQKPKGFKRPSGKRQSKSLF